VTQKILRISKVPPNIGIVHSSARQRENYNDYDQCKDHLEREYAQQILAHCPQYFVFRGGECRPKSRAAVSRTGHATKDLVFCG